MKHPRAKRKKVRGNHGQENANCNSPNYQPPNCRQASSPRCQRAFLSIGPSTHCPWRPYRRVASLHGGDATVLKRDKSQQQNNDEQPFSRQRKSEVEQATPRGQVCGAPPACLIQRLRHQPQSLGEISRASVATTTSADKGGVATNRRFRAGWDRPKPAID